ncbi:MAG: group 1 truncated hemoglobin [Ramlibacter sp.]
MKKLLIALGLCLATATWAQMAPADPAVYRSFGEKPGLVKLMDDLMLRIEANPRLAAQFKDAKKDHVKEMLVEQFCQVTGGPCVYKGVDMKLAHANLDINKGDFNLLVEVLQQSMDAQGVPFRAQNQLLAQLAHMHRDVVTVK